MSDLVTDAMVEAALEGSYDPPKEPGYTFLNRDAYRDLWSHHMRAALEAAAPAIAAKALRSLADDMDAPGWGYVDDWGVPVIYPDAVRARADRIEHDARCPHPKCPGHGVCCCPEVKP